MAKYGYRTVHNTGNMAIVPWTLEIYNCEGFIVKRFGGFNRNRLLRKVYKWVAKH